MKKLFITLCVALLSLGAQAQEKGTVAIGAHVGPTITKMEIGEFKETSTRFGVGAFGQYNFTDHWRLNVSADYYPKKDGFSVFVLGGDIHYLINITEEFKLYPLAGYAFSFLSGDGDSDHDSGIQLGFGGQFNLSEKTFFNAEYKWQPGFFGDGHVIMIGYGLRF